LAHALAQNETYEARLDHARGGIASFTHTASIALLAAVENSIATHANKQAGVFIFYPLMPGPSNSRRVGDDISVAEPCHKLTEICMLTVTVAYHPG
jgi:hypothetical protein